MSDEKIAVSIEVEDKFSSAFSKLNDSLKVIEGNLSKMRVQTEKSNTSMNNFMSGALQAATVFAGFSAMKGMIDNFASAEMAQNKLSKAFENSKGGIGLTKKELIDLGKTLDSKTLFSGEAIASVNTKLISFRNIGGEAFKSASKLALDMATSMGIDASSAASMLGKALSNPTEGLNALKKAGVNFNLEQEIMIEKMVRNGNIQGAQKMILDQLKETYRDQAEEQTKGAGAVALMTKNIGELSQKIGGELFSVIQPLIEFINGSLIPAISEWSGTIMTVVAALVGPAGILFAIQKVQAAFMLLTTMNPWLLAISGAVLLIVAAFNNWDAIIDFLSINFQKLKLAVTEVLRVLANFHPVLMPFKDELDKIIDDTKKKVDKLEKDKATKAENARLEEAAKIKAAEDKEKADKLAAEKKFQDMIKGMNDSNRKEKGIKTEKELEDEFQKKLRNYDKLSEEDVQFLRDEEKRKRQEATKELKLRVTTNKFLIKEDEEYLKDKAKFEALEKNKEMKKNEQDMKRKMSLTEKHGTKMADFIIGEEKKVADEKEANEQKSLAINNNLGNARLEATKEMMGNLSTLMQSKNREMFELGKAASIAQATINTWEGATKALAQGGIMGPVMAAAVIAAGMVQVENISSQSPAFENGGIVGGNSYTGDQINARVNSGEMILNQRQQKAMFDKLDSGTVGSMTDKAQNINYITNVKIVGNGDKYLKAQTEKTIKNVEKRKLQKQQFVRGRYAV